MNKRIKHLLFFCLFFLFICGNVKAADKTVTVTENDSSVYVLSGVNYNNLRCGSNEEIKDPGNVLKLQYITVKKLTGGDIVASWNEDKLMPTGEVTETLVCKYDNSYTSTTGSGAGTTTITFKYLKLEENLEFNFTLDQQRNKTKDLASSLGIKNVTKQEITSGSEYIDLNCGGNICSVSVKDNVTIPENGAKASIAIQFTGSNGNTHKLTSQIDITSILAVMAYGGNYGTCYWDKVSTPWEVYNDSQGNKSGTQNTRRYILKNINAAGSVQFPECNAENSALPFLKFKKWAVQTDGYAVGSDVMASNVCDKYKSASEVPPSTDVYRYFACYAAEDHTILYIDNGKLESSKGWTYSEDYNYYYSTSKKVTLPTAVSNSQALNNTKFLGWTTMTSGDCSTDANLKAAGTTVDSDGTTYSACFTTGWVSEGSEEKIIRVGDQEWLVPKLLGESSVTSCKSANTDYINAWASNGKCVIKGIKSTDGKTYEVKVEGENQEKYTFKIQVEPKDGVTVIVDDSYIVDGSTGSLIDNSEYGTRTDVQASDCNQFAVQVDQNTRREAGYKLGAYNSSITLRAHLYTAKAICNGNDISYVGICIDPGRQEPDSGSKVNYVKERDLNLSRPFDKIVASIYRNAEFIKGLENGGLTSDNKLNPAVAAATFTLRIAAIQTGEDANNNGLGLDEYYQAYKTITKNINTYLGTNSNSWVEKWSAITESKAKNKMFCNGKSGCSISADTRKYFAKYINGFNDISESKEEIAVSSTDTKTEWTDANNYVKTVIGTISGVNSIGANGYIRFTNDCTKKNSSGQKVVTCQLYVGSSRDSMELITSSNAKKNWYDIASENGIIYYKLVIKGNVNTVLTATNLNAAFNAKYSSPNVSDGVAIVTPSDNVNRQRLVLYPDGSSIRQSSSDDDSGNSSGTGSSSGNNGTDTSSQEDEGSLSAEIIGNDGSTIPLVLINKNYIVGTIAPTCDMTKDSMNYKNCTGSECPESFNGELFKASGCCSYVTDETTGFYDTYCSASCTYNSVSSICKYNAQNTTSVDTLEVHEANKGGKDNYTCVVDLVNDSKRETFSDSAGNSYEISSYKDNRYCSLSCKEDWEFKLPAMNNYVGKNAVRAGSFFVINDRDVYIKGTRTCVTTKIDYEDYLNDSKVLSRTVYQKFNEWQKAKAQLEAGGASDYTTDTKKYWTNCKVVYSDTDLNQDGYVNSLDSYTQCEQIDCTIYDYKEKSGVTYSQDGGVGSSTQTGIAMEASYANGSKFDTEYEEGNSWSAGKCVQHNSLPDAATPEQEMHAAEAELSKLQNEIQACQYFQLVTSTNQKVESKYKQILTVFDPTISFEYDESEYMKEIGTNNVLQVNDELNKELNTTNGTCKNGICINKITATYYSSLTSTKAYTGNVIATAEKNDVPDGVEKHNIVRYCTAGGSGTTVVGASKESSGSIAEWSSEPTCWDHSVDYIEARYIKKSIENSSYFENPNKWYVNKVTDIKVYGTTLSAALKNSKLDYTDSSGNKITLNDDGKWTLYGDEQKDNSVFPIKITTARNMYKYSYTLSRIGVFNDDAGTVGRLMGTTQSTLQNNTRTCFYEVIEDICLCCGDVIDTEVVAGGSTLQEMIDQSKYNYQTSTSTGSSTSGLSGASVNSEGQLSFFNSTVSLGDLNSDSERNLGSNWSSYSQYVVGNTTLTTPKGSQLVNYIQEKADKAYDETPEYSYTLNPSAMADIRSYNEAHGYQIESSDLITYGTVKTFNEYKKKNWDVNNSDADDYVTFSHFGSSFLEDRMKSYVTEGYESKVLSSKKKVCYVLQDDYASSEFAKITGASSKSDCRWIDYVSSKEVTLKNGTSGYTRLSFK